jgi:chromosome segregation ATPase
MTVERRNEGIQASGGAISVGGSLAVGRGARASSTHAAGDTALREQLDGLRAAIERNTALVADAEALMADLRRLAAEVEEQAPEPSRVSTLLRRLRQGSGEVAEVVASVASVERVVAALL